jgi:hypothetical protein
VQGSGAIANGDGHACVPQCHFGVQARPPHQVRGPRNECFIKTFGKIKRKRKGIRFCLDERLLEFQWSSWAGGFSFYLPDKAILAGDPVTTCRIRQSAHGLQYTYTPSFVQSSFLQYHLKMFYIGKILFTARPKFQLNEIMNRDGGGTLSSRSSTLMALLLSSQ